MWRTLRISEHDWQQTPAGVKSVIVSLHHQVHSAGLRALAHHKQIALLQEPSAHLKELRRQIAKQNQQILRLQEQAAANITLSAEVTRLTTEVAELKEKLGQSSANSSLPPSSDSPFQKKIRKAQPSGLKQGAQVGHDGPGRWLLDAEDVDRVVELLPESCARCGYGRFEPADYFLPARRQVTEITAEGTIITKYQRPALRCAKCGKHNRAAWTPEAATGAFGSRVKAVVAYLTGRLGASHRDTVEAMHELFGVKISLGSISAAQRQISHALAEPMQEIQAHIERQSIVYVDETGWREKARRKWLSVKNTHEATLFQIRDGRSTQNAAAVVGINSQGVVTTDRYPGYNFIPAHHRQICWAHLKRDFQAISERAGDSQIIGRGLLEQTKEMFRFWQAVRDGCGSFSEFQVSIEPVKKRVNELLSKGLSADHEKTKRTAENVLKLEYSLWTFTRNEAVEPTNNAAERALRRAVLWRKRSFGTNSATGSRFVERILTVVATLRQQGRSVLKYLTAAGRAAVITTITIIKNCEELNLLPSMI